MHYPEEVSKACTEHDHIAAENVTETDYPKKNCRVNQGGKRKHSFQ